MFFKTLFSLTEDQGRTISELEALISDQHRQVANSLLEYRQELERHREMLSDRDQKFEVMLENGVIIS